MAWKIEFDDDATKDLEKLQKKEQKKILNFIHRINNYPTPRLFGKPLKGSLGGLWRYRVGDYRIICKIEDSLLIILVVAVGHRKNIYNASLKKSH